MRHRLIVKVLDEIRNRGERERLCEAILTALTQNANQLVEAAFPAAEMQQQVDPKRALIILRWLNFHRKQTVEEVVLC